MHIESFLRKKRRKKPQVTTPETLTPPYNDKSIPVVNNIDYTPKAYRSWDYLQNEDISGTSLVQNEDISGTSLVQNEDISNVFLGLLSRKILVFLYTNLIDKKKYITRKINIPILSINLEVQVNTVRQCIRRMKKKKILKTFKYSTSKLEGFSQFEINKILIKKVKCFYSNSNTTTTTNTNTGTGIKKKLPEESIGAYRSSNLVPHFKQTQKTQGSIEYEQLPSEWLKINYHFLEKLHFKSHHITDLYELDVLGPEVIQESIKHFAYGIEHNPNNYKKYTDPLKVFYGSLRKGRPWTESTYKSTKEIANEDLIKRRKSEKRKTANEICRLVEVMEKENYERWYHSLTEQQKEEIKERYKLEENDVFNVYDERIYKLHYYHYVIEEYKDPSELALENFIAKKQRREDEKIKKAREFLKEEGMLVKYYKWVGRLNEKEIKEITGGDEKVTEKVQDKIMLHYIKILVKR